MKRKGNKNLLAVCTVLVVCVVVWWASSIQGGVRNFEIKPEISLPESRTDAARAIDAYESVMNRLMDMTERNLAGINADIKDISRMLITVDLKLTDLSKRVSRMEDALSVSVLQTDPSVKSCGAEAKVRNNQTLESNPSGMDDNKSEIVEIR